MKNQPSSFERRLSARGSVNRAEDRPLRDNSPYNSVLGQQIVQSRVLKARIESKAGDKEEGFMNHKAKMDQKRQSLVDSQLSGQRIEEEQVA